jgi:hypothetical protein
MDHPEISEKEFRSIQRLSLGQLLIGVLFAFVVVIDGSRRVGLPGLVMLVGGVGMLIQATERFLLIGILLNAILVPYS